MNGVGEMTINAIGILPCKTDSCPTMGDYAIKKKANVKWGNHKVGDVVLFDFNHNGTSDHIGILEAINKDGSITTIEGNTSLKSSDNGGKVMRRTRCKKDVNYFVRPKYDSNVTAQMVLATARAELGVVESPSGSNKVKYNVWFYGSNKSAYWCCTCVCWIFAHVINSATSANPVKYDGEFPNLTTTIQSTKPVIDGMKSFAKKYADDNTYHYKKWTSDPKTHQCPICHPNSGKGWNCIGYVSAICYHGGKINDVTCSCSGMGNDSFFQNVTLGTWKNKNGSKWDLVRNGGNKIPTSMLKAGDILLFYDAKGKWKHIGMYYGDGKFADSTSGKTQISIRNYSSTTLRCVKAFRPTYTKSVTTTKVLVRGSKGDDVAKLQKFLNWAGFNCGSVDSDFGIKTFNAVKAFQNNTGLVVDGAFGEKSLAKAKEYTK